ncbi:MAG TPA: hypothetical protein HPP54_10595 [Nitrospinae bacterium]|nr:hypothetical protein [Nitrospinota bacterium]
MRLYSMFTTQSHVIVAIEGENLDEVTCSPFTQSMPMQSQDLTVFFGEGTATIFHKDSNGDWIDMRTEMTRGIDVAPRFLVINKNVEFGSVVTSSLYRVTFVLPKDRTILELWQPGLFITDEQLEQILDPATRESFIELHAHNTEKLRNGDTFEELPGPDEVADSDITFV